MDPLRVILEVGPKRRVVAAATDWPGLDRAGATETQAIDRLLAYVPRYTAVAAGAGLGGSFAAVGAPDVIERVTGSSSTDFWGIAHVPSVTEFAVLDAAGLERRLALLSAAYTWFDATAARVSPELKPGSRGGGRPKETIVRHVPFSENHVMSPKVGVRSEVDTLFTPAGLADHRQRFLAAIRTYNAEGRLARRWPIQFLVRRAAHHVLDHAWELEDRDLTLG